MNQPSTKWKLEISSGERFGFGENWTAFLKLISEERVRNAEESLKTMLAVDRLDGSSFVDIGSGSGLFSLAARRLGAKVTSFDYDPDSVACTAELRRRIYPDDPRWTVQTGSALDRKFLATLGKFDIIYSWGVLHHTGSMWEALENVAALAAPGGQLFIAIYNDQGLESRIWKSIKRTYVKMPKPLKSAVLLPAFIRLWAPTIIRDSLRGQPLRSWRSYGKGRNARGMDPWRDTVDWVGGYPFEVARPEEIVDFYRERGFSLERLNSCGRGLGCNEFVFIKKSRRTV